MKELIKFLKWFGLGVGVILFVIGFLMGVCALIGALFY
ncbi:hypothetical protein LCGC14_1439450 [marine sediment metagenome]|uniref:Uncharacterized protein n=1 Tax=marine sediment metagenome TaxID=412755 RepID=A0A0F9K7A7_9ZZZZ